MRTERKMEDEVKRVDGEAGRGSRKVGRRGRSEKQGRRMEWREKERECLSCGRKPWNHVDEMPQEKGYCYVGGGGGASTAQVPRHGQPVDTTAEPTCSLISTEHWAAAQKGAMRVVVALGCRQRGDEVGHSSS